MSRLAEQKESALMERFTELGHQPYSQQAIFFMNAFWEECGDSAEKIWAYYQGFLALDNKKEDGSELDEFYSHKFLENYGETMTALELRNAMRQIDINHDNMMSLLEYLLFRFDQKVEILLSRPQAAAGVGNAPDSDPALQKAWQALAEVKKEIKKIEETKTRLEKIAAEGGVKGNTAKQELFALMNNDPTELNAALLKAEAAFRKAGGMIAPGLKWWMSRELEEAKKYKPKGGVKKAEKFQNL